MQKNDEEGERVEKNGGRKKERKGKEGEEGKDQTYISPEQKPEQSKTAETEGQDQGPGECEGEEEVGGE